MTSGMPKPAAIALVCAAAAAAAAPDAGRPSLAEATRLFVTGDDCVACHDGLVTPDGRDVSIAPAWRASMMANSARDPYWQAAVRRESMDHPEAREEIEDECSACHMPMARHAARASGAHGEVFAHLPFDADAGALAALAEDGVSCAMCHQIQAQGLGTPESFTAGFHVDPDPDGPRPAFGLFGIDAGRRRIMRSASGFEPQEGDHVQDSGLCGSCHTLYTKTRGPGGEVIGTLPEQMPFLEWRHSGFYATRSCQDCHMPPVDADVAISGVLGRPRPGVSRHGFRGGNFFVLRMLARYRDELAVEASASELDAAAEETIASLREDAARLSIARAVVADARLRVEVRVENLTGHKLPTAYPSRRAWIHLEVRAADGALVFASGRLEPDGSIAGNDNDADPRRFEPHYDRIRRPGEVQIYEGILADPEGVVTTGLLRAIRYVKDNRVLPAGFDPQTAPEDIAVQGAAREDADFVGGADAVSYVIDVSGTQGPYRIEAALWYQPIAYRWAHNLAPYEAAEPQRFLRYYRSMAAASALRLARAHATTASSGRDRG